MLLTCSGRASKEKQFPVATPHPILVRCKQGGFLLLPWAGAPCGTAQGRPPTIAVLSQELVVTCLCSTRLIYVDLSLL